MKTKWTKETPTKEAFYWIKYRVGRYMRVCPCLVTWVGKTYAHVRTFQNATFFEGINHGGWGLKTIEDGKIKQPFIRFGPEITFPG